MRAVLFVAVLLLPFVMAQSANDTAQEVVDQVTGGLGDTGSSILPGDGDLGLPETPEVPSVPWYESVGDFLGEAAKQAFVDVPVATGALAIGKVADALEFGLGVGKGAVGVVDSLGGASSWLIGSLMGIVGTAVLAAGQALSWTGVNLAELYAGLVGAMIPDSWSEATKYAVIGSAAAGSTAAAAGATYVHWNKIRYLLPFLGGFSRIATDDLLDHPTRQRLHEIIENDPGIHASGLARRLGLGWGTISHHMDKLVKGELITKRRIRGQICYFLTEQGLNSSDLTVASSVRNDVAAKVTAFVHDHPYSSQSDVAEALGLTPARLSFHARRLVTMGALDRVRDGRMVRLAVSAAMHRVLERDQMLLSHLRMGAPAS